MLKYFDEELNVLSECLNAAVKGPFFRGIFFSEGEFPSVIGPDWDQLRCILDYWPNIDDINLHRQYEIIGGKYSHFQIKKTDGSFYPKLDTRILIRNAIGSCFYWLIEGMLYSKDPNKIDQAEEAWSQYVSVAPIVAHEVCERWKNANLSTRANEQ